MQNGRYFVTHKSLATLYLLKVKSGIFKLYDLNNILAKSITEETLKEWYTVSDKKPFQEMKLYDIEHFVNGQLKETILLSSSYAVCIHKINQLKSSSHTIGLLKPILHT